MEIEEIELGENTQYKYICENCNTKCSYLSDWNKHLATSKHKSSLNGNYLEKNGNKNKRVYNNNTNNLKSSCKLLFLLPNEEC